MSASTGSSRPSLKPQTVYFVERIKLLMTAMLSRAILLLIRAVLLEPARDAVACAPISLAVAFRTRAHFSAHFSIPHDNPWLHLAPGGLLGGIAPVGSS